MAGKDKNRSVELEKDKLLVNEEAVAPADDEQTPASARNIARPATSLPTHVQKKLSKMTVTLLADITSVSNLDQIDKINKLDSQTRTPILSVILAIVAKSGGQIQLDELAALVPKHWNRPLPASPYTLEEFIYMIVRNSDSLRVS
jgi:hypothetical protein